MGERRESGEWGEKTYWCFSEGRVEELEEERGYVVAEADFCSSEM